jgi:SAM-dependent methyltransferase
MFKRRIEIHQEENFEGPEAARQYAEETQKSTMRYRAFLERVRSFAMKGRYLDVGAGSGFVAGIIAQNHPDVQVTALELSADMASVGKDYLKEKGLQDRIDFVVGDAADGELVQSLGTFDLIYSTYTLHHWENPRKVIDNLMASLTDNGVLFLHDLRRVWWLYWIPSQSGFIKSIRGAYIRREVEEILKGLHPECYEIRNEIPFLLSVIIRRQGI